MEMSSEELADAIVVLTTNFIAMLVVGQGNIIQGSIEFSMRKYMSSISAVSKRIAKLALALSFTIRNLQPNAFFIEDDITGKVNDGFVIQPRFNGVRARFANGDMKGTWHTEVVDFQAFIAAAEKLETTKTLDWAWRSGGMYPTTVASHQRINEFTLIWDMLTVARRAINDNSPGLSTTSYVKDLLPIIMTGQYWEISELEEIFLFSELRSAWVFGANIINEPNPVTAILVAHLLRLLENNILYGLAEMRWSLNPKNALPTYQDPLSWFYNDEAVLNPHTKQEFMQVITRPVFNDADVHREYLMEIPFDIKVMDVIMDRTVQRQEFERYANGSTTSHDPVATVWVAAALSRIQPFTSAIIGYWFFRNRPNLLIFAIANPNAGVAARTTAMLDAFVQPEHGGRINVISKTDFSSNVHTEYTLS
jgi:hypothetical protein